MTGRVAAMAILLALAPTLAAAQSADLVLCDRLAADPADPDKPSDVKGVPDVAPSDVATAIRFCKTASSASRRALYQLGRAYAANRQMPEAIGAWRKAADKGSSSAMVELGVLYGTGAGVARDEAQARKLFERAAEAGNPRGVTNLAALGGGGASSDPARARELLARAAETNAESQYQLGLMMAEGTGGTKTMPRRARCSRRRRRKIIPARWSGWARSRKAGAAVRRIPTPPGPITNGPPRLAIPMPRRRWSVCAVPT